MSIFKRIASISLPFALVLGLCVLITILFYGQGLDSSTKQLRLIYFWRTTFTATLTIGVVNLIVGFYLRSRSIRIISEIGIVITLLLIGPYHRLVTFTFEGNRAFQYKNNICHNRFIDVGSILLEYSRNNQGYFPESLDDIYSSDTLNDGQKSTVRCFVDSNQSSFENDVNIYCGKGIKYSEESSAIIAYETLAVHGEGIHVLYSNGKVDWIDRKEALLILRKLHAGSTWPIE